MGDMFSDLRADMASTSSSSRMLPVFILAGRWLKLKSNGLLRDLNFLSCVILKSYAFWNIRMVRSECASYVMRR